MKQNKTREQQRTMQIRITYYAAIVLWVLVAAAFLLTAGRWKEEPEVEPAVDEVVEQIEEEVVNYIIEVVDDQIEEPDDGIDLEKLNRIENAKITAYCICKKCCGKDESHPAYGITASGREAEPFVSVAVDPVLIPLGSKVYVDYGDGLLYEFRADDTGGGVAGGHIDVCYPDHESALAHGVQAATVYWEEVQ